MDTTAKLPHLPYLTQLLKTHLTSLGICSLKNILLFVNALVQAGNISQTKIALHCDSSVKPSSELRKLQRFLNKNLDTKKLEREWTKLVLSTIRNKKEKPRKKNRKTEQKIVIIVDETARKQAVKVMILSVAYQGRMIPLLWRTYSNQQPRQQTRMILEMIQVVKEINHQVAIEQNKSEWKILLMADRGIGNSPELLKSLESLKVYYLVRVICLVQLKVKSSQVSFDSVCKEPGQEGKFKDIHAFKKAGWLPCHAYWCWEPEHKESWLLLSNDPSLSAWQYGLRMWIELGIRDCKSSGWNWQQSRMTNPNSCWLQWFLMSVASFYVCAVGTWLSEESRLRLSLGLSRGETLSNRRSVFRLGLDFLILLRYRGTKWVTRRMSPPEWKRIDKRGLCLTLVYPDYPHHAKAKTVAQ